MQHCLITEVCSELGRPSVCEHAHLSIPGLAWTGVSSQLPELLASLDPGSLTVCCRLLERLPPFSSGPLPQASDPPGNWATHGPSPGDSPHLAHTVRCVAASHANPPSTRVQEQEPSLCFGCCNLARARWVSLPARSVTCGISEAESWNEEMLAHASVWPSMLAVGWHRSAEHLCGLSVGPRLSQHGSGLRGECLTTSWEEALLSLGPLGLVC